MIRDRSLLVVESRESNVVVVVEMSSRELLLVVAMLPEAWELEVGSAGLDCSRPRVILSCSAMTSGNRGRKWVSMLVNPRMLWPTAAISQVEFGLIWSCACG